MDIQKETKEGFREARKYIPSDNFLIGVEQLGRNETDHFKSGLYALTYGFGMESFKPLFDYGWDKALAFWTNNPQHAPIGIVPMTENSSALQSSRGVRQFLKFPSILSSILTVAAIIEVDGRFGNWFNNRDCDETTYEQELNSIIPHFMNEIIAEDGAR